MADTWCSVNQTFSPIYNFQHLEPFHIEFCIKIYNIQCYTAVLLYVLMLILTLFVKILSFFSKEDIKWLILHVCVCNLIYGIVQLFIMFLTGYLNPQLANTLSYLSVNLSLTSVFPLAFSRFFYLYFENYYEKFFGKYKIFIWLILFDIFTCAVSDIRTRFISKQFPFISASIVIFLITLTTLFSLLVFFKVRNMVKILKNPPTNTLSGVRRAAFVCLFQIALISMHMLVLVFNLLFHKILNHQEKYSTLIYYYLTIAHLYECIYTFMVILDTIVVLVVLKSYRKLLNDVMKIVMKKCE